MLCSNRAEGFSAHSSLSSPIPTSCFVDVILVPLPVWVALIALAALLLLHLFAPGLATGPRARRPFSWPYRITAGIYYVLILCNVLMQTLEIVRLSLIRFGIGLLPFAYIGLLLGAALHWSGGLAGRVPAWLLVNMAVWLGGMVVAVVKAVGLDREGDPRRGSKYPMSDQVLDVAVMAGVYGAIAVVELVTGLWRRRQNRPLYK